jgi:hypothetical protein
MFLFCGFFFSIIIIIIIISFPLCFLGNQTERLGIFFHANSMLVGLIYAVNFVYYFLKCVVFCVVI